MKFLRLIMVFVLFTGLFGMIQAQEATENKTKLGAYPIWSFADVDSADAITATGYDCSLFKGNTIYYSYLFDGGSNDSVQIIIMARLTMASSETLVDIPIDTVYAIADNKYITTATFSSGPLDFIYPKVTAWNSNGTANNGDITDNSTVRFAIIPIQNANINVKRSWWDKY